MRPAAVVHFSGGRSGSRASTWGQYSIWAEMQVAAPEHARFNIPIEFSHDAGLTPESLVVAIRQALAVHESLRTRLRRTPEGELRQILSGRVRLPIDIVEVSDRWAMRDSKEALSERLLRKPFDFAAEWPIRVGAIARDGLIRYVLLVVSHHAIDHGAVPFLERTLWHEAITSAEPMSLEPFDQAKYQTSPDGRRITAAAADYWRKILCQAPSRMFQDKSDDPRTPRYWSATLTSWALPLAAQRLSREMKVGPSAVLLAALSATIGLFFVRTGNVPFREVVRRSWIAAVETYQYAYYDRRRIDAVIAEVGQQRGGSIDLSCWINDMRSMEICPRPAELKVANIVRKLGLTEVEWPSQYERHNNVTFGLRAHGSHEVVKLELIADTHVLAPVQMEHILRGIEAVIVEEFTGR